MKTDNKLLFYITKVEDFNGNVRFRIKATFSNSKPTYVELWENAWVINNPKDTPERKDGRNKLKKEFYLFLQKSLDVFELEGNDRAEFTMKFGDEYSARSSADIRATSDDWDWTPMGLKYNLNVPEISRPLNEKEIDFFFECMRRPFPVE